MNGSLVFVQCGSIGEGTATLLTAMIRAPVIEDIPSADGLVGTFTDDTLEPARCVPHEIVLVEGGVLRDDRSTARFRAVVVTLACVHPCHVCAQFHATKQNDTQIKYMPRQISRAHYLER